MTEPIRTVAELEALYGPISAPALFKVVDHIHVVYRPFIEAAPFAVLATAGPGNLDITPRGDSAGFVSIADEKTLILPDRRGNNRLDSLRNIVADPRVALLFLIPGVGETLRVAGTAEILTEPALLDRHAVGGHRPATVLRITVETVFFQCSRALVRSGLWSPANRVNRSALPSAGTMIRTLSSTGFDAEAYDRELPERVARTLY